MKLHLKRVTEKDIDFLYQLLKNRGTNENISHKRLPTYSKHKKFVLSKPYSKWYVIVYENNKIGSIYLTDINEIGLHLIKEYNKNSIKKQVLKKMMEICSKKSYFVNISPKNKNTIKFFKLQGFDLVQCTYGLRK